MSKKLAIAMFGQKRLSREGGVEIVVKELCTRMAQNGCDVTCYNRAGHHVSGAEYDDATIEYKGIHQKTVPTINRRGLAAVTSSFFAALYSAFGKYDVVHIHAEGPAFFSWLPKMFGKRVVVTIHGIDWQREKWQSGLGSKFIHQGEKNAVKYADEVIVLSKGVQDYFKETYGRKTHFIPNGVNRPQTREANLITDKFGLKKDSYILFLGRLVPEKGIRYAKEHGLAVYGAGECDKRYSEITVNLMPFEWVEMFRNAEFVFTGTFHGAVFSILNRRQFKVYLTNESRIKKVTALLEELGIQNREMDSKFEFDLESMKNEINYDAVYRVINEKRQSSKQYLKDAIGMAKQ